MKIETSKWQPGAVVDSFYVSKDPNKVQICIINENDRPLTLHVVFK